MAFQDWKTEDFKKVDVRGIQGNFFPGLKTQAMGFRQYPESFCTDPDQETCGDHWLQSDL